MKPTFPLAFVLIFAMGEGRAGEATLQSARPWAIAQCDRLVGVRGEYMSKYYEVLKGLNSVGPGSNEMKDKLSLALAP
jgi:hypothetical protein